MFTSTRHAVPARALFLCVLAALLGAPSLIAQSITSVTFNGKGAGPIGGFVQITGTGFRSAPGGGGTNMVASVTFNGVPSGGGTVPSDTTISAQIPNGATSGFVRVTLFGGAFAESPEIFIVGSEPYIRRFTPVAGPSGTAVMVFGENFNLAQNGGNSVTGVWFGGVSVTAGNTANQDRLDVIVPAGAVSGPVTVATSFGSYTTSSNFFLGPTITNMTPTNGTAGDAIVIRGINFLGTTQVRFGNFNAAFSNVSNSNLTAVVPAGFLRGKVSVFTPGGAIESANEFLVPPVISAFTPTKGGAGTAVSVTGTNFINVTGVRLGTQSISPFTTNAAGNEITFNVPMGAATGPIGVTTATGTNQSSALFYQPPKISSINPLGGTAGTLVTINGQHFDDVIAVRFSGVSAGFTVPIPGTQIRATVPTGILSGPLVVETPGGIVTNTATFQIQPGITSIAPTSGLAGDVVTISGTNFTPQSVVRFFSGVETTETYVSPTQLTAVVPQFAQTGKISVTTSGGTALSPVDFTIAPPPPTNVTMSIQFSNPSVYVSWPSTSGAWRLQVTTNLDSPIVWTNNLSPTSTVGNAFRVTRPATNSLEVFRLIRP